MSKRKKDVQYLLYNGDKPYSDQKILEFFYGDRNPPYDRESLFRFINTILNDESKHDPDTIGAAYSLRDLVFGVDVFTQIGMRWRKRKEADTRKYIDTPEFGAVMAALNDEFPDDGITQRQHAVNEIAKLFNFSERLAEQYYDEMKESAARALESSKTMLSWGGFEYKVLQNEPKTLEEQVKELAVDSRLTAFQKFKKVQELTGKTYREAQQIYKEITSNKQ